MYTNLSLLVRELAKTTNEGFKGPSSDKSALTDSDLFSAVLQHMLGVVHAAPVELFQFIDVDSEDEAKPW